MSKTWFWVASGPVSFSEPAGCSQITENLTYHSMHRNNVTTVARLWAELIAVEDARFKGCFDRVMFAVLDTKTFDTFKETFEERVKRSENS